jgi:hypothetical protein
MNQTSKPVRTKVNDTFNRLNRPMFLLKVNNTIHRCQSGRIVDNKIIASCDDIHIEAREYKLEWL